VFNLDRPEWWQVLILVSPLSAVVYGLRWREGILNNSSFKSLTPAQRGYALLHYLPPGVSAQFWTALNEEERAAYTEAGRAIRGSGKNLVAPLVKEVLAHLKKAGTKPPSTESNDPLEKLSLAAQFCQDDLFVLLRRHYKAV
jgi:hypothetical protein